MKATVFHGPNDIRVEEVPRPHARAGEAVIRITLMTICRTLNPTFQELRRFVLA
jgi:threonine dehydrogenase-like Zn-dependent dehydrogenase